MWCFLKADGMKKVRRFTSYKVGLMYVAMNHHCWHGTTVLAGHGLPLNNSKGQIDYYSRMEVVTVSMLLDEWFNRALAEVRQQRGDVA